MEKSGECKNEALWPDAGIFGVEKRSAEHLEGKVGEGKRRRGEMEGSLAGVRVVMMEKHMHCPLRVGEGNAYAYAYLLWF